MELHRRTNTKLRIRASVATKAALVRSIFVGRLDRKTSATCIKWDGYFQDGKGKSPSLRQPKSARLVTLKLSRSYPNLSVYRISECPASCADKASTSSRSPGPFE